MTFTVVRNDEDQYSIWPMRPRPAARLAEQPASPARVTSASPTSTPSGPTCARGASATAWPPADLLGACCDDLRRRPRDPAPGVRARPGHARRTPQRHLHPAHSGDARGGRPRPARRRRLRRGPDRGPPRAALGRAARQAGRLPDAERHDGQPDRVAGPLPARWQGDRRPRVRCLRLRSGRRVAVRRHRLRPAAQPRRRHHRPGRHRRGARGRPQRPADRAMRRC